MAVLGGLSTSPPPTLGCQTSGSASAAQILQNEGLRLGVRTQISLANTQARVDQFRQTRSNDRAMPRQIWPDACESLLISRQSCHTSTKLRPDTDIDGNGIAQQHSPSWLEDTMSAAPVMACWSNAQGGVESGR